MKSLSIGRFFGVKLELHFVFIAFFLILGGFELGNGRTAALNRFFELTCVYSFIIIHEFGHISAARSLGIKTSRIVLYPFGGVAFLERFPDGPWKQIYIAIAGPMTNFIIFALLLPFIDLNNEHLRWNNDPLVFIAVTNAILGIFNLIPAFPMDGGRILKGFMQLSIGKRFANTAFSHRRPIGRHCVRRYGSLRGVTDAFPGRPLCVLCGTFRVREASILVRRLSQN